MAYKWRPSKTARRAFAQRMKDPVEAAAYELRKAKRAEKRRAGSRFDYETAGGKCVPTRFQYDNAMMFLGTPGTTNEQEDACNMVVFAYLENDKCHHDHIHVVNEMIRAK